MSAAPLLHRQRRYGENRLYARRARSYSFDDDRATVASDEEMPGAIVRSVHSQKEPAHFTHSSLKALRQLAVRATITKRSETPLEIG